MRISDFKIHNTQKLDRILAKLCEMIIDGQKDDPDYYGMVAACVLDTQDEAVCAVNYQKGDQRVHAEKAAVEKYMNQYGDIPAGSIIITTLSPCSEMMRERYGDDCTDLIEQIGVHKVYCGYEDPTQDDSSNYMRKTFHVMCTKNEKLKELCKSFADTFLEKDATGLYKYRSVCAQVGRQNGKSKLIETRIAYELLQPKRHVAYTAQDRNMAKSKWEEHLLSFQLSPKFAKRIARVSRVNGSEKIYILCRC